MLNSNEHYKNAHGVSKLNLPLFYNYNGETVSERPSFSRRVKEMEKESYTDDNSMDIDSGYKDGASSKKCVKVEFDGKKNMYTLTCSCFNCEKKLKEQHHKTKTYFSNTTLDSLVNNYLRYHSKIKNFVVCSQDGSVIKKISK